MSYVQVDRAPVLPNLNNTEIWHFIGERGVYSESPAHMTSCFDVFVHSAGKLYYRMKAYKDRLPVPSTSNGIFSGVTFHDPMESFISRQNSGNEVAIMSTHHFKNGYVKEVEVLENETTIPFETFLELNLL